MKVSVFSWLLPVSAQIQQIAHAYKHIGFSFADLYYLLQWVDDDELFDTIPALQITPPEGSDLQNLAVGTTCKAAFANELYEAKVIAKGISFMLYSRV